VTSIAVQRPGAIVVGGGHNGLVCAAYLARAGVQPLVVEARHQIGGAAGTDAAIGARVNICNCDHGMIRSSRVIDELELTAHGLKYVELDPAGALLGWDAPGPAPIFGDIGRTLEGLAVHFPHEVDNYRRYVKVAVPVARLLVDLANADTTGPALLATAVRRLSPAALRILQFSRMTAGQVLRSFFTDEGLLGPAMALGPAVWGAAPDTPGTGMGALALAGKHVNPVGRPVGGSGRLTDAIGSALTTAGGAVMTGTKVASILCEGSVVRGVELADGAVIEAPLVVVASDPREAIVRYLRNPPASAREFVRKWVAKPVVDGYQSKVDARLTELPRWKGRSPVLEHVGFTEQLSTSTVVAPTLAGIAEAHALKERGRIAARPMFLINVPSVLDPSVAPPGEHVLSLEVLFTPYAFDRGWQSRAEPERWLEVAATLFEDGFLQSIAEWRVNTPAVYDREYGMPRGYASSFPGGPLAALLGREPELSRYRTPIAGLYLTGAATFPGAGVWGAPGRNAARAILAGR
jgi:phytoene dehydrogenase-like protein